MLIAAGDLNERVTLLGETVTPGEGPAVSVAYPQGLTLWAKVWAIGTEEVPQGKQMQHAAKYEVTVRDPLPAGAEIKGSGRLLWRGRTLHVQGPPVRVGSTPFLKMTVIEKTS